MESLLFRPYPEPRTLKAALQTLRQVEFRLSAVLSWVKRFHGKYPASLRAELGCTDELDCAYGGDSSSLNLANTSQSSAKPRSSLPRNVRHSKRNIRSTQTRVVITAPLSPESCGLDDEDDNDFGESSSPSLALNQELLSYSYGVSNLKSDSGDHLIDTAHGPIRIVDIQTITKASNPVFNEDEDENIKQKVAPTLLHTCQYCFDKFESGPALSVHSLIHTRLRLHRLVISQQSLELLQSQGHRYCIRTLNKDMTVVRRTPAAPLCVLRSRAEGTATTERIQCELCPHTFSSDFSLTNHLKKAHKACEICKIEFSTFNERTDHQREYHPELNCHKCDVCDKSFLSIKRLWHHDRTCHPDPDESTTCKVCGILCKSSAVFKQHMKMRHADPSQAVSCPTCGIEYRNAKLLKTHMSTHAPRSFLCQICGYAAKTKQQLSKHTKDVHTATKQYQCPHCPLAFKRSSALGLHVARHLGKNKKICPHCGVERSANDLYQHIKVVHNGRKFKCQHCPGMYSIRAHLKHHYILKHPDVPIPLDADIEVVYTKTPQETTTPLPISLKRQTGSISSRACTELSCATCPEAVFYSRKKWELHMIHHDRDPHYKLEPRTPVKLLNQPVLVPQRLDLSISDQQT